MNCQDCALNGSCHYKNWEGAEYECKDFTERKFKVGDRVVRIEEPCITNKIFVKVGETGTVVGYSGHWCAPYTVKWDRGVESVSHGNYIELIEKKLAKKPKTREVCEFCIDEETVEDMHCTCGLCHGVTEQVQCPVCGEWYTVGTDFFLDDHGICMQCFDDWTDKHLEELTEQAIAEAQNA